MKKLKLVVPLLLLTALVLTGAMCEEDTRKKREKDDEDEEEELEDYTLYENEKWNFEIYHPEDWGKEIISDNPEGMAVGFTAPAESLDDYFLEGVAVVASVADPYEDFDELMAEIISEIQEDEYWELVDYSEEMIGGYPAYKMIYMEKYYEEETKYLHYFINGDGTWYQIIYAAAGDDKYDKYLEQVETMIDSFELTK